MFKIILTAMDSNSRSATYKEVVGSCFESKIEAEVYMLKAAIEEVSSLNEPDANNTPTTKVFIADLDGDHDVIVRLWDGDDYWDVSYYDIEEADMGC